MEYSDNILKTSYIKKDGLNVIDSGSIVINGIEHVVYNGWIKCDNSLQNFAFNTTEKTGVCKTCFPDKLSFQIKRMKVEQLTLF